MALAGLHDLVGKAQVLRMPQPTARIETSSPGHPVRLNHTSSTERAWIGQIAAATTNGDALRSSPPLQPVQPTICAVTPVTIKGGLAPWQIRRVEEYVAAHLETSLAVDDLATVARVSTGHFCRAFKASLGETPHAYIVRQRLLRAQLLMLHTPDTLSAIACACGLADQAHLTRLFRRAFGTTPRAWRRMLRAA